MSQRLLGTKRVQQSKAHKHLTTTERFSRQQYNVNVILLSTVHAMVLCTVGCTEVSLVKTYSLNHSMSIDKIFYLSHLGTMGTDKGPMWFYWPLSNP